MQSKDKLYLGITVDVESVDAAFERLVKAKEEFESAAYALQDKISEESVKIMVKGKPWPAATDQG